MRGDAGTLCRSGRGRHYTLGEPEEPLVYSPSGTVGYCTATNECGAPGGDMPGPMYVPAADSPQQIGPLMATYWVLQADVQSAMFGGVPGNRAIMPFAQVPPTPCGMPASSPPRAEGVWSQVRAARVCVLLLRLPESRQG